MLDGLVELWKEDQVTNEVVDVNRAYKQYKLHVSPHLGHREPDGIEPKEFLKVLKGAYEKDEGKRSELGKIGAKSVHNLKGTLVSVYAFGGFEGLCDGNPPSEIPKGKLPKTGKQKRPIYSRFDALRLMSDDAVSEEWQVFYALQGLGGMRCGEAAGRRWRDLDWDAPFMPSLFVHSQYQDLPLKTTKDDDHKDRMVAVHRELARILREWWLGGWARRYGRKPISDDFICPNVDKDMQALTPTIVTKQPPKDCRAIGIPNKGNHGFRRWLVTHARKDGGRKDMLERATHNRCGEIIDIYTDPDGIWEAVCEAVACLKVDWPYDNVVRLPVAVGDATDKLTDKVRAEGEKASENNDEMVEAVGIEPYCQRYAKPTRSLGFPAYRRKRRATGLLTYVPCSTLESPCLPWALVTMWSLMVSARSNARASLFEHGGRARRGHDGPAQKPAFGPWCFNNLTVVGV